MSHGVYGFVRRRIPDVGVVVGGFLAVGLRIEVQQRSEEFIALSQPENSGFRILAGLAGGCPDAVAYCDIFGFQRGLLLDHDVDVVVFCELSPDHIAFVASMRLQRRARGPGLIYSQGELVGREVLGFQRHFHRVVFFANGVSLGQFQDGISRGFLRR